MTIPLPPALPPHFNIGGYKITALVESGPDYHLYQALSPEGHAVLIREFCPGGLVTRDLASGELAVFRKMNPNSPRPGKLLKPNTQQMQKAS